MGLGTALRRLFGQQPRLASPAEYQRVLEECRQLAEQGKQAKALKGYGRLVRELSAAEGATLEHRQCLVRAYVAQGRALQRAGQPQAAAQSCAKLQNLCRVDADATADQCAEAAALNRTVVETDEQCEWAHFFLGLAFLRHQEYVQALPRFEAAQRLNPRRPEAAYYVKVCQGALQRKKGQRAQALQLLREATAILPDRYEAHLMLAAGLVRECEAVTERDEPDSGTQMSPLAAEAVAAAGRAASLRPNDAICHFHRGRACSFAGNSTHAIESFRQAVHLAPKSKEPLLYLSVELGKANEVPEALQAVRQALALDDRYADAYQVWGDLLGQAADWQQAAKRYRKALEIAPQHARARLGLGRALYHLGRFDDALRELAALPKRTREATFLLARCAALTDQFEQAAQLLNALISSADAMADDFYYLGCAHANLGQLPPAVEAFGVCLQRAPSQWQAHLQRAHCHLRLGSAVLARADYEAATAAQPENAEVALALARCHASQNDYAEAATVLKQLLAAQPNHWDAAMLLGALAERAGALADAEEAYVTATKAAPKRGAPFARLGLLYCDQSRHREACDCFGKLAAALGVEEAPPTPGFLRSAEEKIAARKSKPSPRATGDSLPDSVLFHWGHACAATGDYAGALELWRRLHERRPDDQRLALNVHRLHYLIGRHHAEAGRYEDAILAWEEYLQSRPEDRKLQEDLAELYFRMATERLATGKDLQAARKDLVTALERNPNHPCAAFYLALCDLTDGQPARAAERFGALAMASADALQVRAQHYEGLALLAADRHREAAEVLGKLSGHPRLKEQNLDPALPLAVACAGSQDWAAALNALQPLLS